MNGTAKSGISACSASKGAGVEIFVSAVDLLSTRSRGNGRKRSCRHFLIRGNRRRAFIVLASGSPTGPCCLMPLVMLSVVRGFFKESDQFILCSLFGEHSLV